MLLLDSEALSAVAHGPPSRRDRVRALVAEMRRRGLPVGTVASVLAEVVRGRPADAGVFAALRRERVEVHPVDTRVGVRAGHLLGRVGAGCGNGRRCLHGSGRRPRGRRRRGDLRSPRPQASSATQQVPCTVASIG